MAWKKTVIAYYGVSGHGKGLVDAMSSFGVKQPLRKAIVERDFFFNSAGDIYNFLRSEMSEKPERKYWTCS